MCPDSLTWTEKQYSNQAEAKSDTFSHLTTKSLEEVQYLICEADESDGFKSVTNTATMFTQAASPVAGSYM